MKRFYMLLLIVPVMWAGMVGSAHAQSTTQVGAGAEEYEELFDALKERLEAQVRTRTFGEEERTIFVSWIRDQVHVMKAMKYLSDDVSSYLELFLERQTPEGLYFDYFYPIESSISHRMNLFDKRYWRVFPEDGIQMHRLPIEADLEYLMVEGAYYVWQATGDTAFVRQWLPTLERGMAYAMNDPLRWSREHQLVKRGYTLDTWDFMDLPTSREEYEGDVQEGIFDIDEDTPMGIMYGDNSGMYAASRQLADMYAALGRETDAAAWNHQAEIFRLRTNELCWTGSHYAHFVEIDPMPSFYPDIDHENTVSLSNPYTINRGMPTEEMAQSIIQTYRDLRAETRDESFAEWFGIYPAIEPDFADYEPGSYMNGGVNTIVAGELAKAALQHGYEAYGLDILQRVLALVREHDGDLPVAYRPDGTVDEGIPDNWGQAAVMSALIEGLAGVVDRATQFEHVELSPRWMAARKDQVDITVVYGPSDRHVRYAYEHDASSQTITVRLEGDPERYTVRLLLPDGVASGQARLNGNEVASTVEQVRDSHYVVVDDIEGGVQEVAIRY